MEVLYQQHLQFLAVSKSTFQRDLANEIDWNERLIALKGARGVGKSTFLLQHIKEKFAKKTQALYITMDSFAMASRKLTEIVELFVNNGGTHLFLDEIHKYQNWSQELKNIYDLYPQLHVVFTSSSILHIYKGYADLSRRAVTYELKGLSFREFVQLETGNSFEKYTLSQLLKHHVEIASEIGEHVKPLVYFKNYLRYGYYPFYLQGVNKYAEKLQNISNLILEVDLPYMMNVDIKNVIKLKKLLYVLATEVPLQPNISSLSASLEITRATTNTYFNYLKDAHLINLLLASSKSYSLIAKPEKVYLHNTNLAYAIDANLIDTGTLRETFFYNQLNNTNAVNYSMVGDFSVNDTYVFEVGGKNKTSKQLKQTKNSYLAADDIVIGYKNKIPLWLFGFLY